MQKIEAFIPSPPRLFTGTISSTVRRGSHVRLVLHPSGFPAFMPGQFVKVSAWPTAAPSFAGGLPQPGEALPLTDPFLSRKTPFLSRAFSISLARFRTQAGKESLIPSMDCELIGFDLLVRVVGVGTECLRTLHPGDQLSISGPLGRNGYAWTLYRTAILVAGGVGVAPLLPLAQALAADKIRTIALLGARTCEEFPPGAAEDLCSLGCQVLKATDDGTEGHQGLVTQLLERVLAEDHDSPVVYACGPEPMLQETCHVAERLDVPIQVSLEAKMACGIGACLGCAVAPQVGDGGHHAKVCVDGPVFDGRRLLWK